MIDAFADEEISIGDYILTGGELASLVVADSVLRLKPGVLAEQKATRKKATGTACWSIPSTPAPRCGKAAPCRRCCWAATTRRSMHGAGNGAGSAPACAARSCTRKWCETHPVTELPKWKRGENMRLVKTDEQFAAAARIFVEGRRATCAENWTPEYCASLNEEEYLLQLRQEKAAGWVCYLHTTKDVPDGIVSINHKVGHIEHLFVTEKARGRGIGMKMLDFARRKLSEHEHPVLSVLNTNTRAIALYTRMGWKLTSGTELEFTPEQYPAVVKKCALVWMRYEGSAQK